jgi:hypothetical protein
MALSIQKARGSAVSLGFVNVPTIGTPVPLSTNIDSNNSNSPGNVSAPPPQFPGTQTESSPSFRAFHIQGFKPGANNNGMVVNSGNVYLLMAAAGGAGNRSDSGSIIAVIAPGADYFFPPDGSGNTRFSPYYLYLDADSNNDGGLVAGYGVEP